MAGLFITLEGIDGCGKTTQAGLLVESLSAEGYRVCVTREPGGSELGERLRELVLSPKNTVSTEAELFLYLADRAQHVSQVVRPALEEGKVVVCERHADSTVAYQGYGRGLDLQLLKQVNAAATGGLKPDLTVVLDLPADRARLDSTRLDRVESAGEEFRARVAEGFREIARSEPSRVKLVNALAPVEEVQSEVWKLVKAALAKQG